MASPESLAQLFRKYVDEEGDLAKCEALYMLVRGVYESRVKDALTIRYEGSPDNMVQIVSEDMKRVGVSPNVGYRDTLSHFFNRKCLPNILKEVERRAQGLSQQARKAMPLVIELYKMAQLSRKESPYMEPYTDSNTLKCSYEAIYTLIGNEPGASIDNIARELIWTWIFEYKEPRYRSDEPDKFYFPPYFDSLLPIMIRIAPKVEIKITWPE